MSVPRALGTPFRTGFWRVVLIRNRGQYLSDVEAVIIDAAEVAAAKWFELSEFHRSGCFCRRGYEHVWGHLDLRVRHRRPGRCRRGLAGSSTTMKNPARPGKLGARALLRRFLLFRLSVDARRAVIRQQLGQSWSTRRDSANQLHRLPTMRATRRTIAQGRKIVGVRHGTYSGRLWLPQAAVKLPGRAANAEASSWEPLTSRPARARSSPEPRCRRSSFSVSGFSPMVRPDFAERYPMSQRMTPRRVAVPKNQSPPNGSGARFATGAAS
jgi:hypothetical protein